MKALTAKNHRSMHSHAQANENLWIKLNTQILEKLKGVTS
jgi:hypothetical protein